MHKDAKFIVINRDGVFEYDGKFPGYPAFTESDYVLRISKVTGGVDVLRNRYNLTQPPTKVL
jgi:hypothetical protein